MKPTHSYPWIPLSTDHGNMASSFSANQYENAFKPQKLQNWTQPKLFKERPKAMDGHTRFIATDKGHLFPGMKAKQPQWMFVGTWDLPDRIPSGWINPTARSQEGQERLRRWGQSQQGSRIRSTSESLEKAVCVMESGGQRRNDSQLGDHMEIATNLAKAEDTHRASPSPEENPSSQDQHPN